MITRSAGAGQPAPRIQLAGATLVLAAAFLWATIGLFGKHLFAAGVSPMQAASSRAALAFICLAAWFALHPAQLKLRWRDLPFFACFGAVGIGLFYILYMVAVQLLPLSVAAALLYTAPGFVLVFSWIARTERIGSEQLVALALVITGVFLLTGIPRTLMTGHATITLAGLAVGLGAGVSYAIYTFLGKIALRRYSPLVTVFYTLGFGSLALAFVAPPWQPFLLFPETTPLLLGLGLGPTLLAATLFLAALKNLRATSASMLASAEPVFASALGLAFLHEMPFPEQLAGVLLIVAAAALIAAMPERARKTGS